MAEPWQSGYHTAAAFVPPDDSSAAQPLQRNFTLAQLHCTPAALSLRGTVYDVSSTPDVYGPEGTYSHLVGHDASIAIAKSFLKDTADLDKFDFSSLSARENMTLNGWAEMLETKGCNTLGRLVQPPAPRPLRVSDLAQHSGMVLTYLFDSSSML
jgi:Cytochrome b5-like Heme/Steroid binding domain